MACCHGRKAIHRLWHPANLLRCRLMGISPTIVLMLQVGEIQNIPVIHRTTCYQWTVNVLSNHPR